MVIETDRLILREMTENDYDALYAVLADSDIMQHYPYNFDEKRVKGWINRNIEMYRIFGFGLWAVCLKDSCEMIGDCGLTMQIIGEMIKPEICYHIRKDHQRGYAKEAATTVRNWTFRNTPFNVIYTYMKHTNLSSASTAISFGCHQVEEFQDKVNETTKVFAITRDEWLTYTKNKIDCEEFASRAVFLSNIDKLHTTERGVDRIKRNLKITTDDVIEYCKNKIQNNNCNIYYNSALILDLNPRNVFIETYRGFIFG